MAGLSPKTAFRAGAVLALLLGLTSLPGCSEDYPDDLHYPLRNDPIVLERPASDPTHLDAPGQMEQWIDALPGKGGKLLDPTATIEKQQLAKVSEFLGKSHFDLTEDEARAAGLTSPPPDKEATKQALEGRRTALEKRIKETTQRMAVVGPALLAILEDLFGQPAKPKVDVEDADEHRLDAKTLSDGARLYRRHCLHCHGLTGDGRGPTGPWVNPHPRDYRIGKFKFTSSSEPVGTRKARREDLLRTLQHGIEGTSMPSFALLDREQELEPLVSYVIHLSLRGQVEVEVLTTFLGKDAGDADAEAVKDRARDKLLGSVSETGRPIPGLWDNWKATEKKAIPVGPAAAYTGKPPDALSKAQETELKKSISRGYAQFTTGDAKCRQCHNDFGRANDYKYDDWGLVGRPANLTTGLYRGGRRPLDLYYRIHAGINGSAMTSFGSALSPDDIWDIINFLEAMPYPKMLPDDVSEAIYGKK
jgi:mono/diheme cytochrome c family protein